MDGGLPGAPPAVRDADNPVALDGPQGFHGSRQLLPLRLQRVPELLRQVQLQVWLWRSRRRLRGLPTPVPSSLLLNA